MNTKNANITERRATVRLTCQTPLIFKVCREDILSKLMEGYTQDVSRDGLRCTISNRVPKGCTLWLKLDRDALAMCEEVEKKAVILQQGILGKVVWIDKRADKNYEIGLQFIIREVKN